MDPLKQIGDVARKPLEVLTTALNRPMARATPSGVVKTVTRAHNLEDAVRDRVVLVTGASSGIGEAAALQIGAAGGTVVLVARGKDKLDATAAKIEAAGGVAHVRPCDLTDVEAIDAMADDVLAELGGVDILVNNAGRSIRRSLALSYERFHDFERTMQLNYFAPLRLMLKLLPGMRERQFGHVINISSVGVQTRVPRFGAYIASKAALDTLSDAFQGETQDDGIRFTTVYMPLVRTPMIAPTDIYKRFPTLTPEEAGKVIADAIVSRPRRTSPLFGRFASFADSVSPQMMDLLRNRGYKMFGDSKAAKGDKSEATPEEQVTAAGRAFAEMTRGVHW